MPNTNCLAGIKCPRCGFEDRFKIEGKTLFEVTDEGTDVHEDVEWDDESYIECMECGLSGKIKDFRVEEDASPKTVTNLYLWWSIDGEGERAIIPASSITDAIRMLWKDGHAVGETFEEFQARMLEADHTEYGVDGVIYDDPSSKRREAHERGVREEGTGGRPDRGAEEGLR